MHKFRPCNGDSGSGRYDPDLDTDSDSDPYSSDPFRMYEFKVRKCTRSRSHDWTDCPFSHPGEKARRRDPRRYHYSGTVCPEYRRAGSCSKGDECEFAHGVFECWLHPARYRTEACKDGKNCKRKVCFFAHSPRELRVLPPLDDGEDREGSKGERGCHGGQHCCRYEKIYLILCQLSVLLSVIFVVIVVLMVTLLYLTFNRVFMIRNVLNYSSSLSN